MMSTDWFSLRTTWLYFDPKHSLFLSVFEPTQ